MRRETGMAVFGNEIRLRGGMVRAGRTARRDAAPPEDCAAGSRTPGRGTHAHGRRTRGFTLIEVMVAMTVLILLVMGLTRMFAQATNITRQGLTSVARNSVAETAMETILQDVDGMIVNERMGCCIRSDVMDPGKEGGFGFDEIWFVSTSGDQDDDMPYEYFHYYVTNAIATNSLGATYVRFDLHKERMIMAVADSRTDYHVYALDPGKAEWWNVLKHLSHNVWDDMVLAENVVRFDFYCLGWNGHQWGKDDGWMNDGDSTSPEFNSTRAHNCGNALGVMANVPPAAFDIYLQVTSPEAAMEGGMALMPKTDEKLKKKGRELMIKESASYFGRAMPVTGLSQLHHPANHYVD